ncbi:hypothetical protein GALMADRAFT_119275 [Galerina marginata CBS 339.88]|uniref:Uncharacterized protein n=1 Tax=Galerina marginata (strain CBS 339.88) TaxID=685588 RepID=A0A067TED3_GALM3|nr:hypothetical protein GALMADRAFT_119275 [Galerina marginata CBS 339.88]
MSDAQDAILANADYHTRLLSTIAELEYVPTARKHQVNYVKDLESQLDSGKKKIVQLAEKTKKERKEHEVLRDSTARRFAHKLVGKREKYEARESKEEREYVEALEREMTERDNLLVIQQLLEEANGVLMDLTDKGTRYESAQAELKVLYERVFDGPSEAFPEDDRLEYDVVDAVRKHEQLQEILNSESRAAELLARASKAMDYCQKSMQEALGYSRYDMWGGGNMADMMERSALRQAQTNASQAEMLVNQAMRVSSAVQPVGRVNIAQGSIVSDIFFDNIFTDMAFHNQIKQSAAQVLLANQRLKAEKDAARRRADGAGAQLLRAAEILDSRRKTLDNFRRATFESYIAHNPPPPSYDHVTTSPTSPSFSVPDVTRSGDPNTTAINNPNSMAADDASQPPLASMAPSMPTPITTQGSVISQGEYQMPEARPSGLQWGSRNPYALAMAEQTRTLSNE